MYLQECQHIPADTRHWIDADLLLGQRLQRWPSIKLALVEWLMFAHGIEAMSLAPGVISASSSLQWFAWPPLTSRTGSEYMLWSVRVIIADSIKSPLLAGLPKRTVCTAFCGTIARHRGLHPTFCGEIYREITRLKPASTSLSKFSLRTLSNPNTDHIQKVQWPTIFQS